MSGVAKDETGSPSTQDQSAAAAPDNGSVHEGSAPARDELDGEKLPDLHIPELRSQDHKADHKGRRAPHLRVVADNETGEIGPPEPAAQRVGAAMRAQRQHLGYDLDSVSKETRIAVSHLRAIEDMTPNVIGQPVYVKGHIRTYARHLKMDPDAVLAQYKDECALLADPEKQDIAPPVSTRKLPVAIPAFGLLIVALVGAAGVYAVMQANAGKGPSAKAAAHATETAAAVDASAVPVAPPLHIVAVKEARIEVRGADGTKFLARTFVPGESYSPRVGAGWTVTTSDGSAFEWRLGDQSLGLLAPEGPVYAQSVDLAMKREPVASPVVPGAEPTVPSPLDANARVPATTGGEPAPASSAAPRPAGAAPSPASRPAAPRPAASAPSISALPTPVKPKPKTPAPPPAEAHAGQPQIGTAPVPTASPAANPTPVTDPSLLAYPPS